MKVLSYSFLSIIPFLFIYSYVHTHSDRSDVEKAVSLLSAAAYDKVISGSSDPNTNIYFFYIYNVKYNIHESNISPQI